MRMVYLSNELEQIEFVKKVKDDFEKHPDHVSYGSIKEGSLLALRWGLGNDCILVLKLDEVFSPVIYQNIIKKR